MTITSSDILTYLLDKKFHFEDSDYLLQDKVATMGLDAVTSARVWIWGRFFHSDRQELWNTVVENILDYLVVGNLTSLDAIRTALEDAGRTLIPETVMLFDVWTQMAVLNIWQACNMEKAGMYSKKEAQEMISAIIGRDAYPLGGSSGGGTQGDSIAEPVVSTDNYTPSEISIECGGYDPPFGKDQEVFNGVYYGDD